MSSFVFPESMFSAELWTAKAPDETLKGPHLPLRRWCTKKSMRSLNIWSAPKLFSAMHVGTESCLSEPELLFRVKCCDLHRNLWPRHNISFELRWQLLWSQRWLAHWYQALFDSAGAFIAFHGSV